MTKQTEKVLKEAVRDAQHTLAEHVEPGGKDCNETISELLAEVDNDDVTKAIEESDEEEKQDGGRQEPQRSGRSQPN